jgi:hypothetical protein
VAFSRLDAGIFSLALVCAASLEPAAPVAELGVDSWLQPDSNSNPLNADFNIALCISSYSSVITGVERRSFPSCQVQ